MSVAGQALSETFYNPDGTAEKTVYGNSAASAPQQVKYRYDGYKRLTGVRYDGDTADRITYDYDASGRIARVKDHALNRTVSTEYDSADRPVRVTRTEGSAHLYTGKLTYDEKGRADTYEEQVGASGGYKTAFSYDLEDRVTELSYGWTGGDKVTYAYDGIGRFTERKVIFSGHTYTTGYDNGKNPSETCTSRRLYTRGFSPTGF